MMFHHLLLLRQVLLFHLVLLLFLVLLFQLMVPLHPARSAWQSL
jgi:hypothetical protein